MKNLLLAILVLCSCAATPDKPLTRAFENTVKLQVEDGRTFCSGVITHGVVLTAFHCVEDLAPVWIENHAGERYEARVENIDMGGDLAILLPVDGRELGKGARVSRRVPNYGDKVWLIGHPLGEYDYSVTSGVISHPRREDGLFGGRWVQHSAPQIGGNSGGPLLNRRGRIIGIASFTLLSSAVCSYNCLGIYDTTHIHGAAHWSNIVAILAR